MKVLLAVAILRFLLKSVLFLLFVVLVFCLILRHLLNRGGTGGDILQFHFLPNQL